MGSTSVIHFGYQVIVRKRSLSEIAPPPVKRTLDRWDALLYLLTGALGAAISAALRNPGSAPRFLPRAVVAAAGAGFLGWAYTQDFKIFGQLKEVAGFNAFSTLGAVLPAVSGAVLGLVLFQLWGGWQNRGA